MACFINNDTASQNEFGIQAKQGDTFTGVSFWLFTNVDSEVVVKKTDTPDDEENLSPFDLTDYTGKMEVKIRQDDLYAVITFETGTASMVFVANEIQLLQNNTTMDIPAINYVYDVLAGSRLGTNRSIRS